VVRPSPAWEGHRDELLVRLPAERDARLAERNHRELQRQKRAVVQPEWRPTGQPLGGVHCRLRSGERRATLSPMISVADYLVLR
jgi:hypothetical protein